MQITSVEGSTSDPDVGQIIGGYNPQSWSSNGEWLFTWSDADRNAFIFNLSTGVKQDQRLGSSNGSSWGAYQTLNTIYSGPTFGSGHDIIVHEQLSYGSVSQYSYGTGTGGASDGTRGQNLLGDSYTSHRLGASSDRTDVTYGQLEVYTFSDVQSSSSMVPEPTSLAVFGAIGFAGCLRRRRVK